jgi:hypothetical protein
VYLEDASTDASGNLDDDQCRITIEFCPYRTMIWKKCDKTHFPTENNMDLNPHNQSWLFELTD